MGVPLSIEEVKRRVDSQPERNIILLSDEHKGGKAKLKWQCTVEGCGHIWYQIWNVYHRGHGCPKCHKTRTIPTLDRVKDKLYTLNPNIEILSKKYKSAHSKLDCRCTLDNHEWKATWLNLRNVAVCPLCSKLNSTKDKNKWINNHNEAYDFDSFKVYIIKIWDDNESFYKIGRTTKTVYDRFYTSKINRLPYNYIVVDTIIGEPSYIYDLEILMHELNRSHSYMPKLEMRGYTECFTTLEDYSHLLKKEMIYN